MPSQAMQDVIDALRDRQRASAGQAPRTLDACAELPSPPGTAFTRCLTTWW